MKEIRIHGRGGQGVVLAAELLAVAAFEDGKFGQAFPSFGGERRGAPVQAFVRLDTRPIRLRHRVNHPDYVLVLDPSLVDMLDVLQGISPTGLVLINSEESPSTFGWLANALVCAIPATRIAIEVFGQPFVNPAMLGAFAAASDELRLTAIQWAFRFRFPGELGEKNARAARSGHDWVGEVGTIPVKVAKSRNALGSGVLWEDSPGLGAPGRPPHFAAVTAPRTALVYPTGGWRYSRPVFDHDACTDCGLCEVYCPDGCVLAVDGRYTVDYEYCKGCGICDRECPTGAIRMVAEKV